MRGRRRAESNGRRRKRGGSAGGIDAGAGTSHRADRVELVEDEKANVDSCKAFFQIAVRAGYLEVAVAVARSSYQRC
jgi:hypothetical protein